MQKHILLSELKIGNIFTKKIKTEGREAFIVTEVDKVNRKITCKSRLSGKEVPMKTDKNIHVTLLRENDNRTDGKTGNLF